MDEWLVGGDPRSGSVRFQGQSHVRGRGGVEPVERDIARFGTDFEKENS